MPQNDAIGDDGDTLAVALTALEDVLSSETHSVLLKTDFSDPAKFIEHDCDRSGLRTYLSRC